MRNLKKFLALVLAMLMVFSMAVITTGAADDDADYTNAANHLAALKILKGDENGNLNLDNGVTRWQAALFFVQALTGKTDASTWNADKSAYFTDVPEYGTAIDYAYGINLIVGRGNGVYGYSDAITYQDMLVMAVRALGYETDNMVYPQGYTLAAQKLGLTENIDVTVNFKDTLTRGETAQIIWDMLQTEVAITDPLSGNLVYPNETSSLELILNAGKSEDEKVSIERTTLLEESGFADAKIEATIVSFNPADEDDEDSVATVTVDYTYSYTTKENDKTVEKTSDVTMDIVAADLGITEDSPKSAYLQLPVTLFVDCDVDKFESKYEDEEAIVVFANFTEYTVVENLGDAGNIKVVLNNNDPTDEKTYVSLGGTKFLYGKYDVVLKVWEDKTDDDGNVIGGWVVADDQTWNDAFGSFVYDKKDGYVGADADEDNDAFVEYVKTWNTYGKVAYRIIDVDGDKDIVEALYTPYHLGQYNVLSLKDAATSKDADFATYTKGFGEEMYLFGSDKKVTENSSSVSKKNGELAKAVTVEGEEIESGDFMFYSYNETDNILTVAKNCGSFEHGRLNGQSVSKETAKISGTSYKFGFDGLYTEYEVASYDEATVTSYINKLETGKNNVKYLAVDGKIVYLGKPDEDSATIGAYDFAVVTTDKDIVSDLLDIDPDDYEAALTNNDVYVDDNGYVAIAVLDKATGEWTLGSLKSVAVSYDVEDEKFTNVVDIATYAKFAELGNLKDIDKYDAAVNALNSAILAIISENDGIYALGAATTYGWDPKDIPAAPEVVAKPSVNDKDENGNKLYADAKDAKYLAAVEKYNDYLEDLTAYNVAVHEITDAPFATAPADTGVVFHTTGKTNSLNLPGTKDLEDAYDDYETAKITMAADTVVVAIFSDGSIGVRVGATKNDANNNYSVNGGYGSVLFAVTDKLIVIDSECDSDILADLPGLSMELDSWSTTNIGGTTNYYVVTVESVVETEKDEDGDDIYTVYDVYDTRNKTFTDITTDANLAGLKVGDVLYLRSTGAIDAVSSSKTGKLFGSASTSLHQAFQGIYMGSAKTRQEGTTARDNIEFNDAESLKVGTTLSATKTLESVNVTAYTMNFFGLYGENKGLDQDDYDFDKMVLATPIARYVVDEEGKVTETDAETYRNYLKEGIDLIELTAEDLAEYVEDAVAGQEYYFVAFPLTSELIETCSEPTEGVFDNHLIKNSQAKLLVPEEDADNYVDAKAVKLHMSVSTTATTTSTSVSVLVTNMLVDYSASVVVKK